MKNNNIINTLHPSLGLAGVFFTAFFLVLILILINTLNPDDPNKVLFVCVMCGIVLSLSYLIYRQRSIDFDGKEFYLENAFYRGITIDVSLFENIQSVIFFTYKIRFTDGRNYLFVIELLTIFSKVIFVNDTVGYDKKLTKQIKEMIDQRLHDNKGIPL